MNLYGISLFPLFRRTEMPDQVRHDGKGLSSRCASKRDLISSVSLSDQRLQVKKSRSSRSSHLWPLPLTSGLPRTWTHSVGTALLMLLCSSRRTVDGERLLCSSALRSFQGRFFSLYCGNQFHTFRASLETTFPLFD